jgi:hypothetical protein
LISGCCWDLRNRFAVTYPSTYRTELADLCVNSILLHGNISTIAADITIDFLTLDDDNANIADGTPNYTAINDSFTLHGLDGPPLGDTVVADDFEATTTDWTVGATGDTATTGIWARVDPLGTTAQPEDDHTPSPGVKAWITGQGTGGAVGEADVDGGSTTLVSPAYDCTGLTEAYVSYSRWYSNNTGAAPNADSMPVEISADNGATWIQLENVAENAGVWVDKTFRINDYFTPSAQVRLRFRAQDLGSGSIVEAGVDDLRIYGTNYAPPLIGDLDGNRRVNGADLGILLGAWGTLAYDLNGDGGPVAGGDLGVLLGNWTP